MRPAFIAALNSVAQLFALNTPLLFEGDSLTDKGFSPTGWAQRVNMYSGAKFFTPNPGNYGAAGGNISGNVNSMMLRKDTVIARITQMVAKFSSCVIWFQIGTNGDADIPTATNGLQTLCAAYRGAGALVIANTCPPSADNANLAYRTALNAKLYDLKAQGLIHAINDVDVAGINRATDFGDNLHYNESGHYKVAVAGAALLATLTTSAAITTDSATNLVSGNMSGTGGTANAGSSGSVATGWTISRTFGDGTIVASKPSANVQRLTLSGGTTGLIGSFNRSDAATVVAGETYDSRLTIQIVSASVPSMNLIAINGSAGFFPLSVNTFMDTTHWAGPWYYRTMSTAASTDAATIGTGTLFSINAGESVVLDVSEPFTALRIPLASALPVNTMAPSISGTAIVAGSVTVSTGTWTGYPAPTFSYQWILDGVNVGTNSASYTVPNSVGSVISCTVTATNSSGAVSQAATGNKTISASVATTTWDSSLVSVGEPVYSNGNLTVSTPTGLARATQSVASKSSGKYYFEILAGAGGATQYGVTVAATALGTGGADYVTDAGNVWADGGFKGFGIFAVGLGAAVCIAVDVSAKLIWFRKDGGNWNNSGTANPATGVGGYPLRAATTSVFITVQLGSGASRNVTLRTASSAWGFSAPSGFVEWAA